MAKIIGKEGPSDRSMRKMRRYGERWAAYQCQDLSMHEFGTLRFLRIGLDCAYQAAPPTFPNTDEGGDGRSWLHVGYVDLATGYIGWIGPS